MYTAKPIADYSTIDIVAAKFTAAQMAPAISIADADAMLALRPDSLAIREIWLTKHVDRLLAEKLADKR